MVKTPEWKAANQYRAKPLKNPGGAQAQKAAPGRASAAGSSPDRIYQPGSPIVMPWSTHDMAIGGCADARHQSHENVCRSLTIELRVMSLIRSVSLWPVWLPGAGAVQWQISRV